jgi:Rrf2 family transcriptional regulator, iron-sulfur cluster assembly transcription factor
MRLELGKRADYAVRAAVDLARHVDHGERRKAQAIAEEMAIPPSYVPQILALLVRSGIAVSVAGPGGGYVLAKDPAEIDLLQVIEAIDGELVSTACILRGGPCRWDDMCAVHLPWARAQQAMRDALAASTLSELVANDRALEAGTFEVPAELSRPAARAVPEDGAPSADDVPRYDEAR